MKLRLPSSEHEREAQARRPALRWEIVLGVLAVAVFGYAVQMTLRHDPQDLRTPVGLAVCTFAATVTALTFCYYQGLLEDRRVIPWCLAFGLVAAGAFYFMPALTGHDMMLFHKGMMSFDLPYSALFLLIRSVLILLVIWPFTSRVLHPDGALGWSGDELHWELGAATLIVLHLIAAVIRLAAG